MLLFKRRNQHLKPQTISEAESVESLTELIHQGMLKMLQQMHDERSPLDVEDKFVNTLLTLAEHLNRLRYCRNRFVGRRKFKDVYGDQPCEVTRE